MTILHVQSATGSNAGASTTASVTLGAPVTSGNAIVGSFQVVGGSFASYSVSDDKGNIYNIGGISSFGRSGQFWLGNITNAPSVITVTINASNGAWLLLADEFSGVATLSDGHTQNQNVPGTGTDAMTSGAITTTVNGDLIVGSGWDTDSAASTLTAGTGFAGLASIATFNGRGLQEWLVQGTASSIAATFTMGSASDGAGAHVVALKAGSGATPPANLLVGVASAEW